MHIDKDAWWASESPVEYSVSGQFFGIVFLTRINSDMAYGVKWQIPISSGHEEPRNGSWPEVAPLIT